MTTPLREDATELFLASEGLHHPPLLSSVCPRSEDKPRTAQGSRPSFLSDKTSAGIPSPSQVAVTACWPPTLSGEAEHQGGDTVPAKQEISGDTRASHGRETRPTLGGRALKVEPGDRGHSLSPKWCNRLGSLASQPSSAGMQSGRPRAQS